jgi:ATP-binding cassette subfamily A (ABC1) protein 3
VNDQKASVVIGIFPFTNPAYVSDDFAQIIGAMLPFFMLLIYILPVYRLLSNMVAEKESRARESMKMMGLSDSHYWLSWFCYYFCVVTVISALCTLILGFNVVRYSNKGFLFLYFWVYGISLFGLVVFLQAFFSKARVASIAGTLIYFGTSFINQAVRDESVNAGSKQVASLLSTVAVALGANNLGSFEESGIGITSTNVDTLY